MKTLRETCAQWLDIRQPSDPETAVWAELDTLQKQFILRGLGIDPTTFVMNAMTRRERNKLFECVKAWAGTAERLQGILNTCRAEQQAEHLRLVQPIDDANRLQPVKDDQEAAA